MTAQPVDQLQQQRPPLGTPFLTDQDIEMGKRDAFAFMGSEFGARIADLSAMAQAERRANEELRQEVARITAEVEALKTGTDTPSAVTTTEV